MHWLNYGEAYTGTVVKFINKCSLLLLPLNRVTSDETVAGMRTSADC